MTSCFVLAHSQVIYSCSSKPRLGSTGPSFSYLFFYSLFPSWVYCFFFFFFVAKMVVLARIVFFLPFVSAFVHPGLLVNQGDIARIKTKLSEKLDPWQSSWDKLTTIKYGQATYVNNAVSNIRRTSVDGAEANADLLWHDAAAAFNLGLRWQIEGDVQYAEAAAKILTAWGDKLQSFEQVDEQYLIAGLQGHQLANAAELIRDYEPFASSGMKTFTDMFRAVFLEKNVFFLNHQAPSEHNHKHFHANWELSNLASVIAFGVLTDNATLFDFAVDYFKNGSGNGAINNAITDLVKEPGTGKILGQPQESGRDQGHTALDFQMLGVIAQQAWNQGEDLYGYNNSRILQGSEYFARYNLGNDVPFVPWTNGIVTFTDVSAASRGATRPTFELLSAHYAQIKGVDAPWTEQFRNYTNEGMGGFEGGAGSWGEGSGHYDGLGWGSLLYRLDDGDVDAAKGIQPITSSSSSLTQSFVSSITTSIAPSSSLVVADVNISTMMPTSTSIASSTSTALIATSSGAAAEVKSSTSLVTGVTISTREPLSSSMASNAGTSVSTDVSADNTSSTSTPTSSKFLIPSGTDIGESSSSATATISSRVSPTLSSTPTYPVEIATTTLSSMIYSPSATWVTSPVIGNETVVTRTVYVC
ncbi:hypothetical protein PVAG01_08312 [Phlyctema vagabunda]|uniref:Alginate lyase domain-containing protein n=1 Tax=Phlyctema vagabunda TaxID=108571 RepID=A0ABR4P924_9HELO